MAFETSADVVLIPRWHQRQCHEYSEMADLTGRTAMFLLHGSFVTLHVSASDVHSTLAGIWEKNEHSLWEGLAFSVRDSTHCIYFTTCKTFREGCQLEPC